MIIDTHGQSVSHYVYHVAHRVPFRLDGPVDSYGSFWYGTESYLARCCLLLSRAARCCLDFARWPRCQGCCVVTPCSSILLARVVVDPVVRSTGPRRKATSVYDILVQYLYCYCFYADPPTCRSTV